MTASRLTVRIPKNTWRERTSDSQALATVGVKLDALMVVAGVLEDGEFAVVTFEEATLGELLELERRHRALGPEE